MDERRAAKMLLKHEIREARVNLKTKMINGEIWPGTRCACGEQGATDLGHVVYSRHPDRVDLYSELNMTLMHNTCNTTDEALWINVNACLILLGRAGTIEGWEAWARGLERKSPFWIPRKMRIAQGLWQEGVRAFDFVKIMDYVNRPLGVVK